MTCHWAVLTGEYPPQAGGVSDYTRQVCGGLAAAGDRVTVFAPPCAGEVSDNGVTVVRLPDHFGRRARAAVVEHLTKDPPDRVLVQYVPHAFGMKGMNLPFARWVRRLKRLAPVWVMVHEVAFPFVRRPLKHNLIAAANRLMARWVALAADRLFVTIPAWGELLRRLAPNSPPVEWLPVPSNLPTTADPAAVAAVRTSMPACTLIGHFGTYGRWIADLLEPCLAGLLRECPDRVTLLVGRNGPAFRDEFVARHPALAGQVVATGEIAPAEAAVHLGACDLLVQPYPDGVSGRRTSAVSGLALGVPLVSNRGALTEPVWTEETGMYLSPSASATELIVACEQALADSPTARAARAEAGRRWYTERFALERTVAALREVPPS